MKSQTNKIPRILGNNVKKSLKIYVKFKSKPKAIWFF